MGHSLLFWHPLIKKVGVYRHGYSYPPRLHSWYLEIRPRLPGAAIGTYQPRQGRTEVGLSSFSAPVSWLKQGSSAAVLGMSASSDVVVRVSAAFLLRYGVCGDFASSGASPRYFFRLFRCFSQVAARVLVQGFSTRLVSWVSWLYDDTGATWSFFFISSMNSGARVLEFSAVSDVLRCGLVKVFSRGFGSVTKFYAAEPFGRLFSYQLLLSNKWK